MIKYMFAGLAVLTALLASSAGAIAAPRKPTPKTPPATFAGTFRGTIHGDGGSSAPIQLRLTQQSRDLSGVAILGNGLNVKGGLCGSAAVPASTQGVTGRTQANDPSRASFASRIDAEGVPVSVTVDSSLSPSGKSMQVQAKVDLPFFCGRDPVLTGTLDKAG